MLAEHVDEHAIVQSYVSLGARDSTVSRLSAAAAADLAARGRWRLVHCRPEEGSQSAGRTHGTRAPHETRRGRVGGRVSEGE